MLGWTFLLLLPTQFTQAQSDFPEKLQTRAVMATVRISTKKSAGSGVVVGKTGAFVYVLTASHVVQDGENLEIATFSERSFPKADKVYRDARVVAKLSDTRDLALVRIVSEDKMLGVLPICPIGLVPKKDTFPVLTVGCTEGNAPSAAVTKVLESKKVRHKAGAEAALSWVLPGTVAKGRSGGPLIDQQGYVIGISSGTDDGKGYYIHADEIHQFLKKNAFRWLAEQEEQGPPGQGKDKARVKD